MEESMGDRFTLLGLHARKGQLFGKVRVGGVK